MTDQPNHPAGRASSSGGVAESPRPAHPSYPPQAALWLTGRTPSSVLELGAGTGAFTDHLLALGHRVTATDPAEPVLRRLAARLPQVPVAVARAEQIPLGHHSVDAVVSAQAFHRFDVDLALTQIVRVLRPGGVLGLARNVRDERVPWVRRLGRLTATAAPVPDPTVRLWSSDLFEEVQSATFRFWQPQTRQSLRELVGSRADVAAMPATQRAAVLAEVDGVYDDYRRGAGGLLMPYLTHCYRARVRTGGRPEGSPAGPGDDDLDTEALLIDFR